MRRGTKTLSIVAAVGFIGAVLAASPAAASPGSVASHTDLRAVTALEAIGATEVVAIPTAQCDAIRQANAALPVNESCAATMVVETREAPATLADLQGLPVAAAAKWKKKDISVRWCWGEKKPKQGKHSGWRCNTLGTWVNARVVYNGKKVYQHWVICDDQGIYNVKWTWCKYTGNGSKKMSLGGNFRTNLGISGVQVSKPYWMRLYVTNGGKVTSGGGNL